MSKVGRGQDGHFFLLDLRIEPTYGGFTLTSDALRAIPVTRMVSWANGGGRRELCEHFGLDPEDDAVRPPQRRPSLNFAEAGATGRRSDRFYQQVASAYSWLVEREGSRRPASEIAGEFCPDHDCPPLDP